MLVQHPSQLAPTLAHSVNGGLFYTLSLLRFVATIAGIFSELDALLICLACVVWTNAFDSFARPGKEELFACRSSDRKTRTLTELLFRMVRMGYGES